MTQAEAGSVKIVDIPCLSLASILELRALIDSVLASQAGEMSPDHGGLERDASDLSTTESIRGATAAHGTHSGRTGEVGGSSAVAADGSDDTVAACRTHRGSIGGE
jgi:hypothetical protein